MSNQLITLLDITKRRGCDEAIGLVEEVTTYAPELAVIQGRTVSGTSYYTKKRTAYGTGGFRKANDGSDSVKSTYDKILAECYIFDAQLQVDQMVANAEEGGPAQLLTDEASGALKGSMITLGSQFYYGSSAGSDGFNGLVNIVDSSMVVDAQGTGSDTTSVWLLRMDRQGIHFIWGNNQGLTIDPNWRVQTVAGVNGKNMTAYVNSMGAWLGLAMEHTKSACRIKNIDSGKPLTDSLFADAYALFPVGMPPNVILMNRRARKYLQQSRTAVNQQAYALGAVAPLPDQTDSIPGVGFTITDSIIDTEVAS